LNHALFRWLAVAFLTVLVDYLIFMSIYKHIQSVFASNLVSGIVATSINYSSHYRWTFTSKNSHVKAGFRYFLNWVIWWIVGSCAIKLLITFHVNTSIAKLLPIIIIAPASYLIMRKLIFHHKSAI
jgi:putative flippase GtrA